MAQLMLTAMVSGLVCCLPGSPAMEQGATTSAAVSAGEGARSPLGLEVQHGPEPGVLVVKIRNQTAAPIALRLGVELGNRTRYYTDVGVDMTPVYEPSAKAIPLEPAFAVHGTAPHFAVTIAAQGEASIHLDLSHYVADGGRLLRELPVGGYDLWVRVKVGASVVRSNRLLLRLPVDLLMFR